MKCDICGRDDIKNLGVHKRFCGKTTNEPVGEIPIFETVKVDEITEKPLSELLSNLKGIMKTFRHELDVRISERGGRTSEVEIRVRIQL